MNISGPLQSPSFYPRPEPTSRRAAAAADKSAARPNEDAAPAGAPAQAPQEASLWEILTEEERAFFQEQASLGPLTYKPGGSGKVPSSAAPTGQRIDVRG